MAWYDTDWSYRKKLDVDQSVADSDLTDFPIHVDIEDDPDLRDKAQASGKDVLFTAEDATTKLDHDLVEHTAKVAQDGVWTWFSRPEAIYDPASDKTFIGMVRDNEDNTGDQVIISYDHTNDVWAENVIRQTPNMDDHNNPVLLLRQDGHICAGINDHTNSTFLGFWISDNPGDIASGGTLQDLTSKIVGECTYAQPRQFATSGDIWLTYRDNDGSNNNHRRRYIKSTDGGQTWSSPTDLVNFNNGKIPYMHIKMDGDILHILYTNGHPRSMPEGENDLWHAKYDDTTGEYMDSAGNVISAPVNTNGTQIWDASTNNANAWNWDLAVDGSGNPVAVFAEIRFVDQDGTTSSETDRIEADHRYRYAKWDGSAWQSYEVAQSAPLLDARFEEQYSPGVVINHEDTSTLYVSVKNSNGVELREYTTSDGGQSWSYEMKQREAFRPVRPRNAHPDLPLVFLGPSEDYRWNTQSNRIETYVGATDSTAARGHRTRARVNVPAVTSGSDTSIFIYYGNGSASLQENRAGVDGSDVEVAAWGDIMLLPDFYTLDWPSGQSVATFDIGFAPNDFSTGNDEHIFTDWTNGEATETADSEAILRKNLSDNAEGFVRTDDGTDKGATVGGEFTDLTFTNHVVKAFSVRYDGSTLEGFMGAIKSADSYAGGNDLKTGASQYVTGYSQHTTESLGHANGKLSYARISGAAESDSVIAARQRFIEQPQSYLILNAESTAPTGRTLNASLQGAPGTLNVDLAPTVTIDAGLQGAAGSLNATVAPEVQVDATLQGATGTMNATLSTIQKATVTASLEGAGGTLNAQIGDIPRLATLEAKLTD
jgi:hypothetical protein